MKILSAILSINLLLFSTQAQATDFIFGEESYGLTGLASASLTQAAIQLDLGVTQSGAVLNETNEDGIGVDANSVSGAVDPSASKFDALGGTLSGQFDAITFSFDTDGVLRGLLFDGLKDETLEYFSLELPNGTVLSIFDFEAELRLNQQGFQFTSADLGVPNPTLANTTDDNLLGIGIPFAANEIFTLTYGEIDYDGSVLIGYEPQNDLGQPTGDTPNGARFQGISVTIPEPASIALMLLASAGLLGARRK